MPDPRHIRALPLLAVCVAIATGCVGPRSTGEGTRVAGGQAAWAFAPASMRVHPLTRVLNPSRGLPQIELYAELTDRWGDTVKGTGALRVELFRVSEGLAGGESGEVRWEIDLSELGSNARLFDPATRTYRVRLERAPAWIAAPEPGAAALLRAVLITTGPNGREVILQSERRLALRGDVIGEPALGSADAFDPVSD